MIYITIEKQNNVLRRTLGIYTSDWDMPQKKLIQLLENAKEKLSKAIRRKVIAVVDQCEVCHKNKKQENRNKTIANRSRDFNEVMAIDLTEWYDTSNKKKFIICHMTDEFTRLSAATFVPDKNLKRILEAIVREWKKFHRKMWKDPH